MPSLAILPEVVIFNTISDIKCKEYDARSDMRVVCSSVCVRVCLSVCLHIRSMDFATKSLKADINPRCA